MGRGALWARVVEVAFSDALPGGHVDRDPLEGFPALFHLGVGCVGRDTLSKAVLRIHLKVCHQHVLIHVALEVSKVVSGRLLLHAHRACQELRSAPHPPHVRMPARQENQ